MKEKPITLKEIWQVKPARYAALSLIVLMILVVVAPFFPRLGPLSIAAFLIAAIVYVVSMWIITVRKQKGV